MVICGVCMCVHEEVWSLWLSDNVTSSQCQASELD